MEVKFKLDRAGFHSDIMDIYLDFLRDLFLSFDIDFDNDFDHRDKGTLTDSIYSKGFSIHYYPSIYGFKVSKGNDMVGEFVEVDRELRVDSSGMYYEFTFEVWTDEENSIYLGDE